jgi:hypothetical protein
MLGMTCLRALRSQIGMLRWPTSVPLPSSGRRDGSFSLRAALGNGLLRNANSFGHGAWFPEFVPDEKSKIRQHLTSAC